MINLDRIPSELLASLRNLKSEDLDWFYKTPYKHIEKFQRLLKVEALKYYSKDTNYSFYGIFEDPEELPEQLPAIPNDEFISGHDLWHMKGLSPSPRNRFWGILFIHDGEALKIPLSVIREVTGGRYTTKNILLHPSDFLIEVKGRKGVESV